MYILDTKPFADVHHSKFVSVFDELKKKLGTSNEIAAVKNIKLESDTLKIRCLDEIEEYERTHQPVHDPVIPTSVENKVDSDLTPIITKKTKKRKNFSISNVAGARTYSIETEQDIDKFLTEIKNRLMIELETDTIITLS